MSTTNHTPTSSLPTLSLRPIGVSDRLLRAEAPPNFDPEAYPIIAAHFFGLLPEQEVAA